MILDLQKVCFSWPSGNKAVDRCTLSISRPGFWMIVGSNGSGKSTLFSLIGGMIKPQTGSLNCYVKTSLVFQNPDHHLLLPTCFSDLLLSLPKNLSKTQRSSRIEEVLYQVGLSGMESRPIHTLSGGQKQRLAIAGALASGAGLLLLDEPTALLDPFSQVSILKIVKRLSQRSNNPITSLWITHRLDELQYCDGAAIMQKGSISNWFEGNVLIDNIRNLPFGG